MFWPLLFAVNALNQGLAVPHPIRTRFQVVQDAKHRFWFSSQTGERFLSLGVCAVDQGTPRDKYDPKNPGYAAFRYYVTPAEWAQDTVTRLQSWGFNTIGAWSDSRTLRAVHAPNLTFTPILHIGSSAGAPWKDMWDPATVQLMDRVGRDGIQNLGGGDTRVIGYFSDNEMGWWEGAMFEWGFKAGPRSRQKLTALLALKYGQSWTKLVKDFDPEGASSFDELASKGRLFLRPGGNGMKAVQAWMSLVADRYYSLCRSIIKKYDPGALYLGDRYISNFYPEVARASRGYVDVCSSNLNADWNDGSFAKFYLPALRRATGKPILITEYYASAKQNRSGNQNNSSGFPVVVTQAQRATVFRHSTKALIGEPFVVGAHWFQFYDEPKNGRGDGENYDFGLVDIDNRPYQELTSISKSLDLSAVHTRQPIRTADARSGVPELTTGHVEDLATWPRDAAYLPAKGGDDRADLYIARKADSLYVALYWNEDRFGEALYRGGHVPIEDRAHFTMSLGGASQTLTARLVEGEKPVVYGATLVSFHPGVRNSAIFQVPLNPSVRNGNLPWMYAMLQTRGRAYESRWDLQIK